MIASNPRFSGIPKEDPSLIGACCFYQATARGDGSQVALEEGRVHVNLVKRWLDDALRVETVQTLSPGRWHHVLVTYDGSREAAGIKLKRERL